MPTRSMHDVAVIGARVEAAALDRHLAEYEATEARDALLVLCPGCGHDQYDHAPDNLPPYSCSLLGCHCSRVPDHLIAEAPDPVESDDELPEAGAA